MGDEVLDEEASQTVRGGQGINVAVVVVGPYLGKNRYLAFLWYILRTPVAPFDNREPEPQVNLGVPSRPCTSV